MTHSTRPLLLSLLVITISAYSFDAYADKGGNGHGNKGRGHWSQGDDDDQGDNVNIVVNIGSADRSVIRGYLADNYAPNCPPGLAKKHNGCLPPGIAKKRYRIGQPIADDVQWVPVPGALLGRLRPVPAGYQYVTVDKDVLLISEATHKVVDAVTLLSAVGR